LGKGFVCYLEPFVLLFLGFVGLKFEGKKSLKRGNFLSYWALKNEEFCANFKHVDIFLTKGSCKRLKIKVKTFIVAKIW
jgi:hypothetical protein